MDQEVTHNEIEMKTFDKRNTRSASGWMEDMRLTFSSGDSTTPDMAVWGSNVHVVWNDYRNGEYGIYYKKSEDNGLNWSNDVKLSALGGSYGSPKIAVYNTKIHVVWQWDNIHYINSTDNGDTWGTITTWDWTSYPPCGSNHNYLWFPDVAAFENFVYISASAEVLINPPEEIEPNDLIFKRSSDGGGTWTDWIEVMDVATDMSTSIETNGDIIYIIYLWGTNSGQHLHRIRSDNQGNTWGNDQEIYYADTADTLEFIPYRFATSMQSSNLHVVYPMEITNSGVYSTWYGKIREMDPTIYDVDVDVCEDHIIWDEEDLDNYRQLHSNKYGQITYYQSNSDIPTSAISNEIYHIIWVDDRDGDYELYYSQRGLYADIFISNSAIQFYPPSPIVNGTTIYINATVFSYSKSATNVEVKFYNDDPDTDNDLIPDPTAVEIGTDTINISKDSSSLASIEWVPPSNGTFNIYVWADPYNNTQEYKYSNNLANKTLEIMPGISIQMPAEGWNLISIPLELSNNDLASVLQPIEGQYDSVVWYNVTDINDPWKHHHISKPSSMNDLQSIDQYKGILLHITEPGGTTLTIIDNKISSPQSIPLYLGWNLVGYPSVSDKNRTEALNSLTFGTDVDSIWTLDATTQEWKEIGEQDYFEVGRGYWIHAINECIWEVPL